MSPPIPRITISSPTGEQVPVLLFPAPAPKSAAVPLWEFFSDQIAEPEPSSAPTTTFDTLAEFKSKRVPADEFVPWKCRICGKNFARSAGLKTHVAFNKQGTKKTLACRAAKLGGILTYGIGQIKNFPVWKAVFMTCGGMTVVWGFVLLFFLPDSIMSERHFTLEERALLIGRGRLARTGVLNKTIKWNQICEVFIDPQVWLLVLFMLLNETINGGIANFGKLIIKGVVKDPLETVALGIPMGAFQVIYILSGTFLASRIKNCRTIIMAVYLIPIMIGVCLLWKIDREHHKIGMLFGYYIIGAFVCSLVLAMQMPASNLGGYTKRIAASAMVFIAYCVGNVIGPHAFLGSEAPLYPSCCITILSCSVAQMVVAIMLRVLLSRRNAQREAAATAVGTNSEDASEVDGADLTDFENPHFRYVL
ncbi:allantoate permease [Fusarium acutatum]|uniref:Allantoate permease n=1 Tax=Fusarium acutatum TaxID=78861 RepID=A0A8H4JIV8_9HYPO|nr:allantoate permease [Fusarium acutatum]